MIFLNHKCIFFSARVAAAVAEAGDVRLDHQLGEIEDVGFTKKFNVVRLDHSAGPVANFSGPAFKFSLTIQINDQVVYFGMVDSTSNVSVLRALRRIRNRFRLPGCRVIVSIDNMAHSGFTLALQELMDACDAEACTQDLFHVVKREHDGISNTHALYISGQVL